MHVQVERRRENGERSGAAPDGALHLHQSERCSTRGMPPAPPCSAHDGWQRCSPAAVLTLRAVRDALLRRPRVPASPVAAWPPLPPLPNGTDWPPAPERQSKSTRPPSSAWPTPSRSARSRRRRHRRSVHRSDLAAPAHASEGQWGRCVGKRVSGRRRSLLPSVHEQPQASSVVGHGDVVPAMGRQPGAPDDGVRARRRTSLEGPPLTPPSRRCWRKSRK